MHLSTRGRYAVMAMVELACREAAGAGAPIALGEIAARQQLSLAYLEQIFARLRRAGLVCSVRGPGGGYRLARPASRVAIAEIVCAADEKLCATRCDDANPGCQHGADGAARKCHTHDLWFELGRQIQLFLAAVTLADVVNDRVAGRAAAPARLALAAE